MQGNVSFTQRSAVNLFTDYELNNRSIDLNMYFAQGHCLFGAVKFNKNANPHRYEYSGYGIGFKAQA